MEPNKTLSAECQECGACCFSDSSAYVPVFSRELERLGEHGAALTHVEDGRRYMKMRDGHCAALVYQGGVFGYSLYSSRPEACRALARGSSVCLEERTIKLRVVKRFVAAAGHS